MELFSFLTFIALVLIVSLAVTPSIVQAQGTDPYTFPVNSSPYGTAFKDWAAKWSAWINTVPKSQNWNFQNSPGVKYVPEDCSYLQNPASPVFFLPYVGAERGSVAAMTCNVPHDKAVIFQIDGATSDYSDPTVKTKTPAELIRLATQSNVYPNSFEVTLDGHPLAFTNDEGHKVQTDLYNLTLPADNLWGEPAGPDHAISQGWWVMLKPLPPGQHTVHYTTGYRDSRSDPTIPPGQGNQAPYIQDVTYHLIVK
jgi:hypothetical protein